MYKVLGLIPSTEEKSSITPGGISVGTSCLLWSICTTDVACEPGKKEKVCEDGNLLIGR
jgi:hypothetical protein